MKKENLTFEHVHIPYEVVKRVSEELEHIGYRYVYVLRKSLHPDDKDLYVVVAEKKDSYAPYYSFWSCYNDSRQSLNHGHYGYDDYGKCWDAALEFVSEGGTIMNKTTENIKKLNEMCKGIKRKFEILEGNTGDLYLVVFNEDEIDYMKEGYEYYRGYLMDDLKTISKGFTPVDANSRNDFAYNPRDLYFDLINGDTSIVANNNGFYPMNCGKAACREFGIDKNEIESEDTSETKKPIYALITVCNRDIEVETFDTYEKAVNMMDLAYSKVKDNVDCVHSSGINAWDAWANTKDYKFDWKIVEL